MPWTYAPTLLTRRDKVRLLIGDTNTNDQLLQDEELCFLESEFGSATDIYSTALAAIDVAVMELARKAQSKSIGPLTISYSFRIKDLQTARARIEALAGRKTKAPTPYAGGISVSDKQVDEADDDVVQPSFRKGGFDNPGAGTERDLTRIRDRDTL